jgi:hypothetical protein
VSPQWKPTEPPYSDPIRDALEDLEFSIDRSLGPGLALNPELDWEMDRMGHILNALEASIEGSVVPRANPVELEPFVQPPSLPVPMAQGFVGPGPPRLPEPVERRWGDLKPPVAATPFFLPDGPKAPSYHPLSGSETGIRNTDEQELMRWCAEVNQPVRQEDCQGCEQWGDHGDGFERCRHDWLAENEDAQSKRHRDEDGP